MDVQICEFKEHFAVIEKQFMDIKQMFITVKQFGPNENEKIIEYYDNINDSCNKLAGDIMKFLKANLNLDNPSSHNAVLRRFKELRKMMSEAKTLANDALIKQIEIEEEIEQSQSFEGMMRYVAQNNSPTGNGILSHEDGIRRYQAMVKSLQLSNGRELNCNPNEVLKANWKPNTISEKTDEGLKKELEQEFRSKTNM